MTKETKKKYARVIINADKAERGRIRWLMVVYDSIIYMICWWSFFILHPSMVEPMADLTNYIYLIAGYILFFGARLLTKCYKQIWRYGLPHPFLKELIADVLAAGLLLISSRLAGRFVESVQVPFVLLVSFVAVYILFSLAWRVFYWQLYRFALKDTKLSKLIRLVLTKFV